MATGFSTHIIVSGGTRAGASLAAHILGAHPDALLVDGGDGVQKWWRAWTSGAPEAELLAAEMLDAAPGKYTKPEPRSALAADPGRAGRLIVQARYASLAAARLARLKSSFKIIHMTRDPRAVAVSMEKLAHQPHPARLANEISQSPVHAARLSALIGAMRDPDRTDVERRGAAWAAEENLADGYQAAGLDTLVVRFEDLLSDPAPVIEAMRQHAGLAPSPALEAHHKAYRGFSPTLSERRRPLDTLPLTAWRPMLTGAAEKLLIKAAGGAPARLGYGAPPAPSPLPPAPEAAPILFIGRGGSGTRLLSAAAQRIGVSLGERLNASGDSMSWSELVYALALRKQALGRDRGDGALRLTSHAAALFAAEAHKTGPGGWGWKLPESLLILPEISAAFPACRFVHLIRHPVTSALRRTHKTSRLDNPIGRAALAAAYESAGRDPKLAASDPDHLRNAYTWLHQVGLATAFRAASGGAKRVLEVRYEDYCARPAQVEAQMARFIGVAPVETPAGDEIDPARNPRIPRSDERAEEVWALTAPLARRLGYALSDVVDF